MTLVPPTPFILAKLKFHMKERLSETEYKDMYVKLGPFHEFRLGVSFRNPMLEDGKETIYEDQKILNVLNTNVDPTGEVLNENKFEDIDKCLHAYFRLRKGFLSLINEQGIVRFTLCSREEATNKPWGDIFIDEFPVNILKKEIVSEDKE